MAQMKLFTENRSLDDLFAEARLAVNTCPSHTATFTYYGVDVLYSIRSNTETSKRYVLAALRGLCMPVVVPTPEAGLSDKALTLTAPDLNESETMRRARLMQDRAVLDAQMTILLNSFEADIAEGDSSSPFVVADWVAEAATLMAHPLLSWNMRQAFNCVMGRHSAVFNTQSKDDFVRKAPQPYKKAFLEACRMVHDLMQSNAENVCAYGAGTFKAIVDGLKNEQNRLGTAH